MKRPAAHEPSGGARAPGLARRVVLVASLLGMAALVTAGCHVSSKAPDHAFSDDAAARFTLPHRLRNGPEHDAALQRTGNPYVLEANSSSGGALLYYGARHSREKGDPQIADIIERWVGFGPTVALCEGRQSRHFYGFLVEPFAGLPENTLVHKLARRDDVALVSLEPAYADEVRMLMDRFAADQVALYFFLRVYTSEAGGDADEALARDLLAKRTDVEGLRGSLETLGDVDALWSRDYPEQPDWRVVAAEPRTGWLAEISDASRTARGVHMARVLVDLVRQDERVLAVVGSGHVIRQEWALRAALGMEPAWDQPRTSGGATGGSRLR